MSGGSSRRYPPELRERSWTLRALSAAGNGDAVVQPSGAGIHEVDVKIT